MFSAQPAAPHGSARLLEVRLSLNTPVVAIPQLPVGPAAAGVALRSGPGGPDLVLALRSVRSGHIVFFAPEEDWCERHGPQLAMDAALSFAERMGFLFDESPGEPADRARSWTEFLREAPAADGELPEETCLEEVAPAAPHLSKFRFVAALPAPGRLAAPLPQDPVRQGLWARLLSRF